MSAPRPYRIRAWRARLSREDWLSLRRTGLGSSDAPVLLGLSPFMSPYALWLDKLGQLVPREDTPHQAWGRRLEGVVADWIREATAWPVQQAGAVLQSRAHPILLADLDRWIIHPQYGRIPCEIKTTSQTQAAAWRDGPPPHVLAQVWHQCAVTGAPAAVVAVAIWGQAPQWWAWSRPRRISRIWWRRRSRGGRSSSRGAFPHRSTVTRLRLRYSMTGRMTGPLGPCRPQLGSGCKNGGCLSPSGRCWSVT